MKQKQTFAEKPEGLCLRTGFFYYTPLPQNLPYPKSRVILHVIVRIRWEL